MIGRSDEMARLPSRPDRRRFPNRVVALAVTTPSLASASNAATTATALPSAPDASPQTTPVEPWRRFGDDSTGSKMNHSGTRRD